MEMYKQDEDLAQQWKQGNDVSYDEMLSEKWMPECTLCEANFIDSVTAFLKPCLLRSDSCKPFPEARTDADPELVSGQI